MHSDRNKAVESLSVDKLRFRGFVVLGLLLGAVFGIGNLIATRLNPLGEDSPIALLVFYGPMFGIWGLAGFAAARQTGRLLDGVKVGALVALITFIVFDVAVIVRANLFLEILSQRSDWQNMMVRFQASGSKSLRSFANYVYLTDAPFKILVASTIGIITGLIGGVIGSLRHRAFETSASPRA
jgi:hypothetical protein